MFRRTITTVAVAMLLGLTGTALVSAPAHAADLTPAAVTPCPLTETQLANGRQIVAQARLTVDRGAALLGSGYSRPTMTPIANPAAGAFDTATTCLMAMADVGRKNTDAQVAFAQLAACVAAMIPGGRGCGPEMDNLESALHELEVALNNLSRACPCVIL